MAAPLDGILVVALEQAVAAPLCSMRLADAGARVIKIERPEGDFARGYDRAALGESSYFVWLNRGKESLAANLADAEDLALVRRIIAQADVFLQNLAPGAASRLGLDSAALRAAHPRLITCDISGYGEVGPYRDMKAYDLLVQCETGLAEITGSPEAPGRVGVSVADIACGTNAYAGILEALALRERTGTGAGIATSLFAGMAEWMAVPLLHLDYGGAAPKRVGLNHPSIAPYGAFQTRDGKATVLSIQNEREWQRFCAIVLEGPGMAEDPRYADNASRCQNRADLERSIDAVIGSLDADGLQQRLLSAGIAFGRVNGVDGLSSHPQLRRIDVQTSSGAIALPAPPVTRPWDGDVRCEVPDLGEQTAAIRQEFDGGS